MDEFLQSLPKPVIVFLVILLGVGTIYLLNPPKTECDIQMEQLKLDMGGVFLPKKVKSIVNPSRISAYENDCRQGNSAGACLDYFSELKKLVLSIEKNNRTCLKEALEISEVHRALQVAMDIMVRIAWDGKKPNTLEEGLNWFTESDRYLFCIMKNLYLKAQGEEAFEAFKTKTLDKLQDSTSSDSAMKLSNQDKEPLTLFALPCDNY